MTFSSQRIVLSSPKLRPLYRKQVSMVTARRLRPRNLVPQKLYTSDRQMNERSFLAELKRRNVYKIIL
jgi:hypothetical protein